MRYKFANVKLTKVHPDTFGQVRRVTVWCADGNLYDWEVSKICLLEADIRENIGDKIK